MNILKNYFKLIFSDKIFCGFVILGLFFLILNSLIAYKYSFLHFIEIEIAIFLALINFFLALISVNRIQLLSILFVWNLIIINIYTIIYIFKTLL